MAAARPAIFLRGWRKGGHLWRPQWLLPGACGGSGPQGRTYCSGPGPGGEGGDGQRPRLPVRLQQRLLWPATTSQAAGAAEKAAARKMIWVYILTAGRYSALRNYLLLLTFFFSILIRSVYDGFNTNNGNRIRAISLLWALGSLLLYLVLCATGFFVFFEDAISWSARQLRNSAS